MIPPATDWFTVEVWPDADLLYIVGMVGMVTCGFYVIWPVTREW